jgi:hypothetical protein
VIGARDPRPTHLDLADRPRIPRYSAVVADQTNLN